jgi:hypothetical protein
LSFTHQLLRARARRLRRDGGRSRSGPVRRHRSPFRLTTPEAPCAPFPNGQRG